MAIKKSIIKIIFIFLLPAFMPGCEDLIKPLQDFKENQYPSIISFTSDLPTGTELTPNLAVTLTVEAYDPEREPLNFEYDSEDGSFSEQNDQNDTSTVVFHTADYLVTLQTVRVSVRITDIKGFSVSQQMELGQTREGPTITVIDTIPEYITSDSQTSFTFSANESGLYQVQVYDNTGEDPAVAWDDSLMSYYYGIGDNVAVSIDGPSWAGYSGNAQLTNPPDRIYLVLKDSLESIGTYTFVLKVDDDPPVSSVNVAGTSSLNPIPVTISSTDAKSGVASISYTLDGSTPDFSGNGTLVSGDSADLTIGTSGVGIYTLSFRAIDNLGNIENTNTETYLIQADVTSPGPVTDLIATQAGGGQISLSWTEPSDDDLDHVLITWTPGGATGVTVPAGTTSEDITGFSTGITYTLTVIAVDTSYNESTDSTITITPPASLVPVHYVGTSTELDAVRGGIITGWDLDDYYIQTATIYLDGEWTAIGTSLNPFTGTFDGNSYEIRGIYIYQTITDYQGLFGYASGSAQFLNITIVSCNVTGYADVGGLAGYNAGTVTNCHITGTPSVSGENTVGGLIGRNSGAITDCHSNATVDGVTNNNGGLIGYNISAEITNSYATGNVTGGLSFSGGLIGYNDNAPVANCYAEGVITGDGDYNGGLIGINNGNSTGAPVTDCHATGNVIANNSSVSNNGGLIGYNDSGTITGCHAEGYVTSSATEIGPYNGGLIGRSIDADITDCYAIGNVSAGSLSASNNYNGGLIGSFEGAGATIYRCYAIGIVSGINGSSNGGLAGISSGTIQECFASGNVSGEDRMGGLVGTNQGDIIDSFSRGYSSGTSYAGGLVGTNSGSVLTSYSTGSVSSMGYFGGLIGATLVGGTDTDCYYDEETSGYYPDSGWNEAGTPTSTADMKIQGTFTGWNFSAIWGISGSINDGYPYLLNNN